MVTKLTPEHLYRLLQGDELSVDGERIVPDDAYQRFLKRDSDALLLVGQLVRVLYRRAEADSPAVTPDPLLLSTAEQISQDIGDAVDASFDSEFPPWYELAKRELGTSEIRGAEDNPRIVEYHQATTLKASDDETPWCSSFVCWLMESCGIPSTRSAAARSWLKWGRRLGTPREGCVVVIKRGNSSWQGHVGLYVGQSDTKIEILGGNQGNAVSIASYDAKDLLGYRWSS